MSFKAACESPWQALATHPKDSKEGHLATSHWSIQCLGIQLELLAGAFEEVVYSGRCHGMLKRYLKFEGLILFQFQGKLMMVVKTDSTHCWCSGRILTFMFFHVVVSATRRRPTETTNVNCFGIGTPWIHMMWKFWSLPRCSSQWLWNYLPVSWRAFLSFKGCFPDSRWMKSEIYIRTNSLTC